MSMNREKELQPLIGIRPSNKHGVGCQNGSKGTTLPTKDIWIAPVALRRGLSLYSGDVRFRQVQRLVLLP
jgi:hypothetical protein